MTTTSETLREMYEAMRNAHGPQGWWPAEASGGPGRALEICLGAILTQNTSWKNVTRALANLRDADVMSLGALAAMDPEALAELIRPAGYFRVKTKRVKNFVSAVYEAWGEDICGFLDRSGDTLREELLAVNGIGRETADSMILYAAERSVFVVDTYTCRILARHRLIGPEDDYESVRMLFEDALEPEVELYNDYHAQLVRIGKDFCRPRKPRCERCALAVFPHDVEPDEWMV